MKKFYVLICMVMLGVTAWAADITFTFSTVEGLTALGIEAPEQGQATNLTGMSVTNGTVTMTTIDGGTATRIWNSQGSYSLRVYQNGALTFKTSAGVITKVVVTAASSANFQFAATSGNLTSATDACTWTGSAGSVTLTHTETKNSQVATVVVTVNEDGTPDDPVDPDPVDPSLTKLASFVDLYDLADGTEFQFTGEAYVNYQNGSYLYVMDIDEEGYVYPALIYGNIGKEYNMGAVIPSGWTGTKTTYKGLVEVTGVKGLADAVKMVDDEEYYSPFDVTGHVEIIIDPQNGWENYKVSINGVRLSAIDEKGNFSITSLEDVENEDGDVSKAEVVMPGFNKFGIEYPANVEGETFNIEGMVTIYNGNCQLYPISIEQNEGDRLWRIWYYGEDGNEVKVADSLYVVRPVRAADELTVYVTDNATQILYDEFADFGYVEWIDWDPEYIALDCGKDETLFNTLSQMKVLAPGSVCGTLMDSYTNPRIVLRQTPRELADAEMPEIEYYYYDLKELTYTNGNQCSNVSGTYTEVDGKPYLYNPATSVEGQKFLLDFRYMLEKPALVEGVSYDMFVVWKQLEPWDSEDEDYDFEELMAPAKRNAANPSASKRKAIGSSVALQPKARNAARRMPVNAADYYTNMFICPFKVTIPAAITSLNAQPTQTSVYNVAGVRQNRMHRGVNIVVTDGKARKVIF